MKQNYLFLLLFVCLKSFGQDKMKIVEGKPFYFNDDGLYYSLNINSFCKIGDKHFVIGGMQEIGHFFFTNINTFKTIQTGIRILELDDKLNLVSNSVLPLYGRVPCKEISIINTHFLDSNLFVLFSANNKRIRKSIYFVCSYNLISKVSKTLKIADVNFPSSIQFYTKLNESKKLIRISTVSLGKDTKSEVEELLIDKDLKYIISTNNKPDFDNYYSNRINNNQVVVKSNTFNNSKTVYLKNNQNIQSDSVNLNLDGNHKVLNMQVNELDNICYLILQKNTANLLENDIILLEFQIVNEKLIKISEKKFEINKVYANKLLQENIKNGYQIVNSDSIYGKSMRTNSVLYLAKEQALVLVFENFEHELKEVKDEKEFYSKKNPNKRWEYSHSTFTTYKQDRYSAGPVFVNYYKFLSDTIICTYLEKFYIPDKKSDPGFLLNKFISDNGNLYFNFKSQIFTLNNGIWQKISIQKGELQQYFYKHPTFLFKNTYLIQNNKDSRHISFTSITFD